VPETLTPWRNDLLHATAPRPGASGGLAARALTLVAAAMNEIAARLADIPRGIGARLFLDCDEEACWHGWQITPIQGGLGRSYRDPRFDMLHDPAGPAGQVPGTLIISAEAKLAGRVGRNPPMLVLWLVE